MSFQYGSMREQICPPQLSSIAGNISTPGTLYFFLQGRNDAGYNLPSTSTTITYTASSGIRVTLPGDCLRSGENILQYSLSVNTIDDPVTSKVLVNLNKSDITLPHTIDFTEDSHLLIEESVAVFPTGVNRIPGMMRQLLSTGLVYRYIPSSTLPSNGTTVISADVGNWEQQYNGFSSYVANTSEDTNGANLNVLDILDSSAILTKSYSLDGSAGPERVFWLRNTTTETISQGTRVGLNIAINGQPASEEFESLIKVVFNGYVDPSDGLLDLTLDDDVTPMDDIGIVKDYQFGRTDLILQKPLLPNVAYQITVFPQFNSYELQSIPLSGTSISVLGFFFDEAGSYNDASALIGDIILPENPNLRRIYPSIGLSVFADEGSGTVAGFFFKDIGSNVVPGLIDGTSSQQIAINNNGSVYLNDASLESNEAIRALVSTVPGESATSEFTELSTSADESPNITVTVPYPTIIDPDYDDVIAGSVGKGTFNAEEIILYIRREGVETRKFVGLAPTNTVEDEFTVSWSSGTVSSVNTESFGLWAPLTPTSVITTTGGIDVYEVAVGYVYLGNSVTGISHKVSDGAIPELSLSISELSNKVILLEENAGYWKNPVSSYSELKDKIVSTLLDGQSNRITSPIDNTYEIWTWVSDSSLVSDDLTSIRPNEYPDDTTVGRWIKVSGGGSGGGDSFDPNTIVTAFGKVVVDSSGYVVTAEDGGPIDPSSSLDDYLDSNVISGSLSTLSSDITLTDQSAYAQVMDGGVSDRFLNMYDGGTFFRKHFVYNKGTTNSLTIRYNLSTLSTLAPSEQAELIFDTVDWLVI